MHLATRRVVKFFYNADVVTEDSEIVYIPLAPSGHKNGVMATCPATTCPATTCPATTCPVTTCPATTCPLQTCPTTTCPRDNLSLG
jgi:hypothetical protein